MKAELLNEDKLVRVTVCIPESALVILDRRAEKESRSRSNMVACLIKPDTKKKSALK